MRMHVCACVRVRVSVLTGWWQELCQGDYWAGCCWCSCEEASCSALQHGGALVVPAWYARYSIHTVEDCLQDSLGELIAG